MHALEPLKHPLSEIEDERCPSLKGRVEHYLEEARKRAKEVGHPLTLEEVKTFQLDLEIAQSFDQGKITKQEAFRQKCAIDGYRNRRISRRVSLDLYNSMHKLTDRLGKELSEDGGAVTGVVTRHIEEVRKLAASFNHRLTCADEEIFHLQLETVREVDEGKITRDNNADSRLYRLSTRQLINFI